MTLHERLLYWSDDVGLTETEPHSHGALQVADSWLVRDGQVRALELHKQRFLAGCASVGTVSLPTVTAFWTAAVAQLPEQGEWFPRVELLSKGKLAVRIRPAPRRTQQVNVWIPPIHDPRRAPQRKGPDLDLLADLRREAIAAGADEALLLTPQGFVVEGATTSLLWWEDSTLCAPSPGLPTLPGVTTQLIQQQAVERNIPVRHSRCQLKALAGLEVWLVNALHGIRPVSGWVGVDVPVGLPRQAAEWRTWLDNLAEPIHSRNTL